MSKRMRCLMLALSFMVVCWSAAMGEKKPKSPLSQKETRRVIARTAGSTVSSGAVRIKTISPSNSSMFDVVAQFTAAFRLLKDESEIWHVVELRIGNDQWEDVEMIARAVNAERQERACDEAEISALVQARATADASKTKSKKEQPESKDELVAKERARCLIARLVGLEPTSDAVNINEVSPLELPFSNSASSVVEAQVEAEFHLEKATNGKWAVTKIRTGSSQWRDIESLVRSVDEQKRVRARRELETVATALEIFRRTRGFYVTATSEAVLIDQLTPRYLNQVIRVDPWHRPYRYEGTRDRFILRSLGADGKAGTDDDVTISSRDR